MIGNPSIFRQCRVNLDAPPDSFSPWEISKHDFQDDAFHETECIDDQELQRINRVLSKIISDPRWTIFLDFVDEESFPLYYKFIAHPICLHFIQERLLSDYYRRMDAFLWDVDMIYEDAFLFNDPSSMIVSEAKALVELIRGQVAEDRDQRPKRSSRRDVEVVYNFRNKRRKS